MRKLIVAALTSGSLVFAVTAAEAASPTNRQYENLATQLCLDSNPSGVAYTLGCNRGNYQKWLVSNISKNTVKLKNKKTNLCLDSNRRGRPYTRKCNNTNFQNWRVTYHRKTNSRQFTNVATNMCLDSNAKGQAYTHACNPGDYQKWQIR